MSKKTQNEIPADMWLHVATDALARYVAGGGPLEVAEVVTREGGSGLMIILPVALDDPRLPATFAALFEVQTQSGATP